MLRTSRASAVVAAVVASLMVVVSGARAAPPVNKCMVNGTVTYQREPCPSNEVRKTPTLEELNAEEKRKREAAKAGAKAAPLPVKAGAGAAPVPAAEPVAAKPVGFHCDGRQYCSQMTSCDEAKYFLANCPRAKMDGDKNGTPCEKQWCHR